MGWPQYVWVAVMAFNLVVAGCKHGKPYQGKHHLGHTAAITLLSYVLLDQGGFWRG